MLIKINVPRFEMITSGIYTEKSMLYVLKESETKATMSVC